MEKTKLEIAENILKECYWGNTNMTPSFIVEHIQDKDFAKRIFSAIFQNSLTMIEDLKIFDDQEMVKEFIISQNQRLGYHKRFYYEERLDELIAHYGIKDAGKRREIYIQR
ncbi:hypothetical protein [Campylobacter lari]|uniref:hypothetical protein n=1 Tax=Campylobacter lari TaxID=201 RepID=UPI0037295AC1